MKRNHPNGQQSLVCPKCKTTIACTQRYMNLVKKHYKDVARVKLRVFGKMKELENKRRELEVRLYNLSLYQMKDPKFIFPPFPIISLVSPCTAHSECKLAIKLAEKDVARITIKLHVDRLIKINMWKKKVNSSSLYTKFVKQIQESLQHFSKNKRNNLSSHDAETLGIQIQILEQLNDAFVPAAKISNDSSKNKMIKFVDQLIQVIINRDDYLSQQEVKEINIELQRFHRLSQMSIIESSHLFQTTIDQHEKMRDYEEATKVLDSIEKYIGDKDDRVNQIIRDLQLILKQSLELHENERKQIVKAMGLKQGHWFKCPNGHIYVITECGGAMEVGKCNECGAAIGGTQHRL
ncbi:unnamed protein product, partial [Timema podura]|nr:unnamed protein product [Timema podura]